MMTSYTPVYPLNRSTYGAAHGRAPASHATLENVAFRQRDPFRDMLGLHEQLGLLVGTDAPGWTPPVDLYETAAEFVLVAEVPGLRREQIEIHAEDNRITIRGVRESGPAGTDVPCEQYHRVERGHGRFSRTFALPEPIDVDGVSADLRDGLLTITIRKAADHGRRRINVT